MLPDGTVAFVLSRAEGRVSVVDLRHGTLLANLRLAGRPSQMILKPDGGELYVLSPEAHGLQVINTWTHELGDYVLLGSAPTYGALLPDATEMFVSDNAADRIAPLDVVNRKVLRPIMAGRAPTVLAFDSNERPSLLLAVNESSADLAVYRISTDSPGLLTMIPVGDAPREVAVKLFQ